MHSQSKSSPPSMLHWTGKLSLGVKVKVTLSLLISGVTKINIHTDGNVSSHKPSYSPVMPEKEMASEPCTGNDEVVTVADNPVEVLVALTVTVCCPPDTPVYWKPDIPTRPSKSHSFI